MSLLLEFPVILIHGYMDNPVLTGTWKIIEKLFREVGVEYFTPIIPPFGSIEERSISLTKQIYATYPGRTVHLFGHSMGGLNAREIAATTVHLNLGFQVKTVTTFGTPHLGCKAIDFVPSLDGATALASTLRATFGTDGAALGNLTHNFMIRYNALVSNNPHVQYFS